MHIGALGHYVGWLVFSSTLLVAGFAWLKGGAAERTAAGILAAVSVVELALQAFGGGHGVASLWLVSVPFLAMDFLLSCSFLWLTLRFGSLWLGSALLAQAGQMAFQAVFIANGGHHHDTFAKWSNLCEAVLLVSLVSGTATAWRRRANARSVEAGDGLAG